MYLYSSDHQIAPSHIAVERQPIQAQAHQAALKGAPNLTAAPPRAPAAPPLSEAEKEQLLVSYYNAINGGDFQSAYALLSPAYHAYQNYSDFVDSYSTKARITIDGVLDWPGAPGMGIRIIDAESTDSGSAVNYFVGYFRFAYDASAGQWLIDERHLTKVASRNIAPPDDAASADSSGGNNGDSSDASENSAATNAGRPDSASPIATAAPENATSCTPATIAEVAPDDSYVTLDGGAKYDVVNIPSGDFPMGGGDAVTICVGQSTTITKGDQTIQVRPHE